MTADLVKNVKRTSTAPTKDADFGDLGVNSSAAWLKNPQITLPWMTQAQHKANVDAFNTTLTERQSTGGGRKEVTAKLDALDVAIDEGTSAVKGYLVYKFEKANAPSYYPQFGIVRAGSNFIIPRDRNKRAAALPLTLAAITALGFANEKYGAAFWQTTMDSYKALLTQASEVDGTVSNKVSAKNELRKTIKKTHNALINILKANYPDTYKSVIREWGFQKEKY